jgi:hypothetical protein
VTDKLLYSPIVAGFGFVAVFATFVYRGLTDRRWNFNPIRVVVQFLGGVIIPYGIVLCVYPFLDKPPDHSRMAIYLPVAGFMVFWAARIAILEPTHSQKQMSEQGPR